MEEKHMESLYCLMNIKLKLVRTPLNNLLRGF